MIHMHLYTRFILKSIIKHVLFWLYMQVTLYCSDLKSLLLSLSTDIYVYGSLDLA